MFLAKFFPVFLLACSRGVSVHVEPPTNVTLICRNMHNILKWSYGEMQPGLRFRVNIFSKFSPLHELWVDPPTLQANVSSLSDPNDDYSIDVTAVLGVNESDTAPPDGIAFSYFMRSPAELKCVVDFPPVNITAEDDHHIQFYFMHPWLLYRERWPSSQTARSRRRKSDGTNLITGMPEFTYEVKVIHQSISQSFTCESSLCSGRLAVDPAQEICLKVEGEMQKILVVGKPQYCAVRPTKSAYEKKKYAIIVIPAVTVIILVGLALIFCMVYRKKTRASTPLPQNLKFPRCRGLLTTGVTQDHFSVPEVDATSPTPLLSKEEGSRDPMSIIPSSADQDIRLPIGLPGEDGAVREEAEAEAETEAEAEAEAETEAQAQAQAQAEAEEESDERHEYMPGNNLEEDETQPWSSGNTSGYEKRSVVVKLGSDDEQAEGYRY